MKKVDLGIKLLKLFKEQRKYFTRNADGERVITNHILYNSLEDELYFLQLKIGCYNKSKMKKKIKRYA